MIGRFLLALLISTNASAFPTHYFEARRLSQPMMAGLPVIKSGTFTQTLDHESVDLRTFKQRYWTTTHYAKGGSKAPVLLYLCGEGACNGNAVLTVASTASALGANVVALEHRYYGKSQPFADLATSNLQYLTTNQAVADIVDVKHSLASVLGWSGPWIVMGGSYAGVLAAHSRVLHPEEFIGALASSAPVVPTQDLSAYDEYLAERVPSSCAADIQRTLGVIESTVSSSKGLAEMFKKFAVKTNVTRADDFLYLLGDVASAAIQLGMKDRFCERVGTDGVDGYATVKIEVDKAFGDFAEYSAEAAENVSLARHEGALGMRQWFYQSCTEFGLWQNASTNPGRSVRSKMIDPSYHDELCQRLFGLPGAADVGAAIEFGYRSLLAETSSHVFMTSGSEDPWLSTNLSPFTSRLPGSKNETYGIKGGNHCSDLGRSSDPSTMAAKKRFAQLATDWISHP